MVCVCDACVSVLCVCVCVRARAPVRVVCVCVCVCVCFGGARGKRRGFSPGAAARHSQSARVHMDLRQNSFSPLFSEFIQSKKSSVQPAELETKKCKKKWFKIRRAKKI